MENNSISTSPHLDVGGRVELGEDNVHNLALKLFEPSLIVLWLWVGEKW